MSISTDDDVDLEDSLQIDEPPDCNIEEVSVSTECPAPLSDETDRKVLNEEEEEDSKTEETETKHTLQGDGFHNVTLNMDDFQVSPTRCYKHHVEHWFAVLGPDGLEKTEEIVEEKKQKPLKSTISISNQENNNRGGKLKLLKKNNAKKPNTVKVVGNSEKIPKESLAYLPDVSYGEHLSVLSQRQHQIYIAMHVTYSLKNRFNFKNDKANLNNVKASLAEEYIKFNEFVRNHTLSDLKDRYTKLPLAIFKYTTDCILNRNLHTSELMPEWFDDTGPLVNDFSNYYAFMEFKQLLLKTGSVCEFHKPDLHRQAGIRFSDFASVAEKYPPTQRLKKIFIHQDPNVKLLLKKYQANVISTMSTIRALLTGNGWLCCKNFDIPIRIELLENLNSHGEKMKVLFALKPICNDCITAPNARRLAAKYACKAFILRTPVTDIDMSYCNKSVYLPSSSNTNLPSTSEIQSNEGKAVKKGTKKPKLNEIFNEMLQNVPGFGVASIKKSNKHQQIPAELPSNYVEPETAGIQWHYNLWKLGNLNLIIRSNNDAVIEQPSDQPDVLRRVDISFAPKVEFQPCHGGEKLSPEELQYHYWTSWLKRTKHHFIPRLHYATGDILGVDKSSSEELLRRISKDGLMGENYNKLYRVLKRISDYDEGWYILRYNSKQSSLRLFKQSDNPDESSVKSTEIFQMQRPKKEWISEAKAEFAIAEIDPEIILQWHIIKKRIPCTFPPSAKEAEKKETNVAKKATTKEEKLRMDDDVKPTELRSALAHLRTRRTRHIEELMELGTFSRNIEFLKEQRRLVGALVERTKQQLDQLNVELTDELDNFQQSAEQFAIEHSPFLPFVEIGKICRENQLEEAESVARELSSFHHLHAREHRARVEIAQLQQSIEIAENSLSEKRLVLSREMIILDELRSTNDRVERSCRVQVKHLKLALQTLRGQSSVKRKRLQTLQNQLDAFCCKHLDGRGFGKSPTLKRSAITSTLFVDNFHQFQYRPKICTTKQHQLDAEFFPSLNTIRQSVDDDDDDDDNDEDDDEDKENNDQ
ncbi:NMDA receptor-regulated protein 2 [Trichinella papuae]|uniref:NMDA receptor-regulated protein 2 n=1 Tax=Trichinella papuae TaxID=268474 RepID=A0A0V1M7P0_9BILA|nr:NMDA receptor-regulated protein 2 [Trichinella papuae]